MKNYCLLCVAFLWGAIATAQVTENPEFDSSSTEYVEIKKVEFTPDHTIFSMKYVSKPPQEVVKEYLNNNPDIKEELGKMSAIMRDMYLQQMMQEVPASTFISFQPGSILRTPTGDEFKFVKAENIPESPGKLDLKSGKNHDFVVYFERLTPGIEKIDLIENPAEEKNGTQFWNFYGLRINNPADPNAEIAPKAESATFVMRGKVYNKKTEEPISAKVTCTIEGETVPFDSVITSRTGYFEFLVNYKDYVYRVEAQGYETMEHAFDLDNWSGKSIERDFYLKPKAKEEIEKVDDKTYRLNNVYFGIGKVDLMKDSFPELDKVVKMLDENPEMRIRVDGHTDNQGDSKLNLALSMDRAKNVRDYLISKGISAERIEFKGWGDTKPVFSNADGTQRKKNRRVEIVVLD